LAQDLEAHYFTENEIEEENVKKERKQWRGVAKLEGKKDKNVSVTKAGMTEWI
jgi:hypothetical protein